MADKAEDKMADSLAMLNRSIVSPTDAIDCYGKENNGVDIWIPVNALREETCNTVDV